MIHPRPGMRRIARTLAMLGACLLPALAVTHAGGPHHMPSASQPDSVDQATASARADRFFASVVGRNAPGGAVIVIQHGTVLLRKAYGLADLRRRTPLTTEHLFHIGSIGKQFTAILILMLCDEHKLRLDDTISRYLPQLPPWSNRITIRQLLNHTSGLADYTEA